MTSTIFRYQRSQQDGGKRYDQLTGGDGNLIADLRNLMLDFAYLRYFAQRIAFFDNFSATVSLQQPARGARQPGRSGATRAPRSHMTRSAPHQ
ncbi:MAG: hypothetical protein WKF84_24780 [Pyrinomonadaceae bacterium]